MILLAQGETVTVLPAPARDRFGDPTGTPADGVDITGVAVWPAGTSEQHDESDTTFTHHEALLPPGTAITRTDQVRWRGDVYDVDGDPVEYTSPLTGTQAGVLVRLAVVTG